MYNKLLFSKEITVPLIIEKVSKETKVSVIDLTSPDSKCIIAKHMENPKAIAPRKREIVWARQLSMKLSKEYTKLSLASIGSFHGDRDHSTVLYASKVIQDLLETNDTMTVNAYYSMKTLLDDLKKQRENDISFIIRRYSKLDIMKVLLKAKTPIDVKAAILKELNSI